MTTKRLKAPAMRTTTLKLSPACYARADALIRYVASQTAGPTTRSDVFREALLLGLTTLEQQRQGYDASRDERLGRVVHDAAVARTDGGAP